MPHHSTNNKIERVCAGCGETFHVWPSEPDKYHSRACYEQSRKQSLPTRFWARVDRSGECWLWNGEIVGNTGYGRIWVDGRPKGAHRISYEMHYGKIGHEVCVLHKCDVRNCVRPDHLFLGTRSDNIADAKRKRRNAFGKRNARAILTENDVREIRALHATNAIKTSSIAMQYGVSVSTIYAIVNRVNWQHLK